MADKETRRSVVPNSALIDSLRKRKGWTIEKLAQEADVGMRTAQKALAGQPISLDTLSVLADTLGVPYENLLATPPGRSTPERINFDVEMSAAQAGDEVLAHQFLHRFIASLQKLATPDLPKSVKIPTEIRYPGETGTRDFMDHTYRLYTTFLGREEGFVPWKKLSDIDRLRYSVSVLETWLGSHERDHPIDWSVVRPICTHDPKLFTAEERYLWAGEALKEIDRVTSQPGARLSEAGEQMTLHLNRLREQSWLLHELEQVKAILTAITSKEVLDDLAGGES